MRIYFILLFALSSTVLMAQTTTTQADNIKANKTLTIGTKVVKGFGSTVSNSPDSIPTGAAIYSFVNSVVGGNKVTSAYKKANTDSIFLIINSLPVFAFRDSLGIDSLRLVGTTIQGRKNGVFYNQLTLPTVTVPNLQNVTNSGGLTTNTITVSNGVNLTNIKPDGIELVSDETSNKLGQSGASIGNTLKFPYRNGTYTIPVLVNGQSPDSTGNVDARVIGDAGAVHFNSAYSLKDTSTGYFNYYNASFGSQLYLGGNTGVSGIILSNGTYENNVVGIYAAYNDGTIASFNELEEKYYYAGRAMQYDNNLGRAYISGGLFATDTITGTTMGVTDSSNRMASTAFVKRNTPSFDAVTAVGSTTTRDVTINSIKFGRGGNNTFSNYGLVLGGSSTLNAITGTNSNMGIGGGVMPLATTSTFNVGVGGNVLAALLTGIGNTGVGAATMNKLTDGNYGVAFGYGTDKHKHGNFNVMLGSDINSNYTATDADTLMGNVFLGYQSARQKNRGKYNTYLGTQTGYSSSVTDSGVFVGNQAGYNEATSNKLIIANTASNNLVYGDFSTKKVKINAGATPTLGNYNFEVSGTSNFSDTVTAPTMAATDSSQRVATTAFVKRNGSGGGGSVDLSNYVDRTTAQTVAGAKTFSSLLNTTGLINTKIVAGSTTPAYGSGIFSGAMNNNYQITGAPASNNSHYGMSNVLYFNGYGASIGTLKSAATASLLYLNGANYSLTGSQPLSASSSELNLYASTADNITNSLLKSQFNGTSTVGTYSDLVIEAPSIESGSSIGTYYAIDQQGSAGKNRFAGELIGQKNLLLNGSGTNSSFGGTSSIILGNNSYSTGNGNFLMGDGNQANSSFSFLQGTGNTSYTQRGSGFGLFNSITGDATFAAGIGNITRVDNEIALGSYNENYTVANNTTDRIFSIGIGTGSGNRIDGFRMNQNGEFKLRTAASAANVLAYTASGQLKTDYLFSSYGVNSQGYISSPAVRGYVKNSTLINLDDFNNAMHFSYYGELGQSSFSGFVFKNEVPMTISGNNLVEWWNGSTVAARKAYISKDGDFSLNGALMFSGTAGTTGQVPVSNGSGVPTWTTITGGGAQDSIYFWKRGGNAPTGSSALGTTNSRALSFITAGVERMKIDSITGNVGIGAAPTSGSASLTLGGDLKMGTVINFNGLNASFTNNGTGQITTDLSNIIPASGGGLRIGASVNANDRSVVDIVSTSKGVLFPRLTQTQRLAITSVPKSLFLYDSTVNKFKYYDGTIWRTILDSASAPTGGGVETDPIVAAVNGIVKSNGTTISAAVAGTDYAMPNATNTNYANDYRAANFVAGTNYLAPNGSAAALTSFPTLNQNTTGSAASVPASGVTGIRSYIGYTANATNANLTVAAGTAYHLPSGTLTANRTINVSALTTAADFVEIYNNETAFTWTFTGATVYLSNETAVTTLLANTNYQLRFIDGKIRIIN